MGATIGSPDYLAYRSMYDEMTFVGEPMFQYLIYSCNLLNIPYKIFRLLCILIPLILINKTVIKVLPRKYLKYYYLIYFILPVSLFMDSGLLRNFIAASIFIYAIPSLLEDSAVGKMKYFFLVIIASLFQVTAIIYLPFIIYRNIMKNRYLLITFKIILIVMISLLLLKPIFEYFFRDTIVLYLSQFFPKVYAYTSERVRYGSYFMFELQLIMVYFMKIAYRQLKFQQNIMPYDLRFVEISYMLTLYLLLTSPLLIFGYTFLRITRNLLPFVIMIFVLLMFKYKIVNHRKSRVVVLFVLIYIQFILLDFRINVFEMTVGEGIALSKFFTDNWILF